MSSPIERAIDKACGVPPGWKPKMVRLRCPKCKRTKTVSLDETDPDGTAVVEVRCERHTSADFEDVRYFDRNGKELEPRP